MSGVANFAQLRCEYEAALAEERAHDAMSMPAPKFDFVSEEAETENDRLTNIRHDIEDVLMDMPSPDPAAFAFKYLVAHGGGRATDCWNEMLEQEAMRFAGASGPTDSRCGSDSIASIDRDLDRLIADKAAVDWYAETSEAADAVHVRQDALLAIVEALPIYRAHAWLRAKAYTAIHVGDDEETPEEVSKLATNRRLLIQMKRDLLAGVAGGEVH